MCRIVWRIAYIMHNRINKIYHNLGTMLYYNGYDVPQALID